MFHFAGIIKKIQKKLFFNLASTVVAMAVKAVCKYCYVVFRCNVDHTFFCMCKFLRFKFEFYLGRGKQPYCG